MGKIYITGLGRANNNYDLLDETHLYEVTDDDGYYPLCSRGFNRDYGLGFSIFRGNVGDIGVCQVCEGRGAKQRPGLRWKRSRKTKKAIERAIKQSKYSPLLPGLPLIPDSKYFPVEQSEVEYV